MFDITKDCILAADGGGTRCRLALASSAESLCIETGPTNITTDFSGATQQLISGLHRLAERADIPFSTLEEIPTYLGLAGFQAPTDTTRLKEALPFRRIWIEDDRPAAVHGALGDLDGAVAHAGTGSFLAVKSNGTTRLGGGWGSILGDRASAAWFGKLALSLVLDAEDGLRRKTDLSRSLVNRFGSVQGILEFANRATPADFGTLAPLITQNSGDPIAQTIIHAAIDHLDNDLRLMGWAADSPICLTGGLAPHLAPHFPEHLKRNVTELAGSPLDGAIALARSFANEEQTVC